MNQEEGKSQNHLSPLEELSIPEEDQPDIDDLDDVKLSKKFLSQALPSVTEIIQVYQKRLSEACEKSNPLVLNKGKIKEDWSNPPSRRVFANNLLEDAKFPKNTTSCRYLTMKERLQIYTRKQQKDGQIVENIETSNNSQPFNRMSASQCNNSNMNQNQDTTIVKESNNNLLLNQNFQAFEQSSKANFLGVTQQTSQKAGDSPSGGKILTRQCEKVTNNTSNKNITSINNQDDIMIRNSLNFNQLMVQKSPQRPSIQFLNQVYNKVLGQDNISDDEVDNLSKKVQFEEVKNRISEVPENMEQSVKQDLSLKKSLSQFEKKIPCEGMLEGYLKLTKMQTQKENFLSSINLLDFNSKQRSYVYLARGLSNENQEDNSSLMQYRNEFFENDEDLEQYHLQIKEALIVQFQKEINISHSQIKSIYDQWIRNFQEKFKKTSTHKKSVVFDLDETLVRVQREEPENGYDYRINIIDQENNSQYYIYVKFRPHLVETLEKLREHYELILFTAASDQYAQTVLQTFDGHQYFDHIMSRKQCLFVYQYNVFVKDLTVLLNNRSLKDIVIIDNKIESYSSNLENGIPIISYTGQEDDKMLKNLLKYLLTLKDEADVRARILNDFFLNNLFDLGKVKLLDSQEIKDCVQQAKRASLNQCRRKTTAHTKRNKQKQ